MGHRRHIRVVSRRKPVEVRNRSRPDPERALVGIASERDRSLTLALFGKEVRADSLLVIPRDLAPVPPAQSDSFRNSSARSTDPFGSPIPKSRLHTQPIPQIVICDTLKLRSCTRSDRAQLRTHPSLRKKSFTRTHQLFQNVWIPQDF